MSKLLCLFGLLLTSVVTVPAQVGVDPGLVDRYGSPVLAPAKMKGTIRVSGGYRKFDQPRYHISGTLRAAERNAMGERLPPKNAFEYTPVVPQRDTVSVYVFDEAESAGPGAYPVNPVSPPSANGVIELFPSD
jgi:hypothetical protein